MSHVTYSNHFYTKCFTSGLAASAQRGEDNPCYGVALEDPVPSKYKRLQLVIQNQAASGEVLIGFGDENGLTMKLYAGQSVSFENYNGPIEVSDWVSVLAFESFA